MGRITVRDLAETARDADIVVADRDVKAARRVAKAMPRTVRVVEADASDPSALARALDGARVLINACHHDFNLRVMDAALQMGAHYADLGGLFHVTKLQMKRDAEFRAAGLLALCGIGSAPGIVNVMARSRFTSLWAPATAHAVRAPACSTRPIRSSRCWTRPRSRPRSSPAES
jgi:saccharopine dehydrogenase (NAD+, L-lysine-forming)